MTTLEKLAQQYQPRTAPAKKAIEPKAEPKKKEAPAMPNINSNNKAAALEALQALLSSDGDTLTRDDVQAMIHEATKDLGQPLQVTVTAPKECNFTIEATAHKDTKKVTTVLAMGEHVYLYGPSGSGKTTMARDIAKALDVAFHATGAVFEPYSLLGYRDAHGEYVTTDFRKAYEYGGVFLWDEFDASNPEAVAVFNMALANKVCAFPDGTVTQHKDFYAVAAGNTKGRGADAQYTARQALDGATLDRFVLFEVGYDTELEHRMGEQAATAHGLRATDGRRIAEAVQEYRQRVTQAGQTHLVTPRTTVKLVKLAAAGLERHEALEATVYAHVGEDARQQARFPDVKWPSVA